MKRLVSMLAAGVVALASASAQSNFLSSGSPTDVIPNFNPDNLLAAVQPLAAEAEILNIDGVGPVVGVILPSGVRFLMVPSACGETGATCTGVSIQSYFQDLQLPLAFLNSYNGSGVLAKAVGDSEGVAIFHYVIADNGIFRGNFNAHISVMDFALRVFIQGLQSMSQGGSGGQAVSVSLNEVPTLAHGAQELLVDIPHSSPKLTDEMKAFLSEGFN